MNERSTPEGAPGTDEARNVSWLIMERLGDLKGQIRDLDAAMAARFDAVHQRFQAVDGALMAVDHRFEAMNRQFEAIDRRFEAIDRRFDSLDHRLAGIDARMDGLERRWSWALGLLLVMALGLLAKLLLPHA
jgi:chromosome segregation ATPase